MIQSILLKDFTIISELLLDFNKGMTALTGETGAGKSIIIDAIGLALGDRLNGQVVRTGCNQCEITLSFDIGSNPRAQEFLQAQALQSDEECLLRRVITAEGRSRAFINNKLVTLQLLAQLGSLLVDIHGQHEHQGLSKKEMQLQLLDAYGQHDPYLNPLQIIYKNWRAAKKQQADLQQRSAEQNKRRTFLQFQLTELNELNLTVAELEQLEQEHKQLTHGENLLQQCQSALERLADGEVSATSLLHQSQQSLLTISAIDPKIAGASQLLNDAIISAAEAEKEIRYYFSKLELNPEKLREVEERLSAIHNLARKYRVNAKALCELQQQLNAELQSLDHLDEALEKINQELAQLEANYKENAQQLTTARTQAAKVLAKLISQDLQQLGMPQSQFEIKLIPRAEQDLHAKGAEQLEFLVSANPGQPLQPLAKVASGGELSRISLAIQVNTAKVVKPATLIFDEVDTGVGGGTAEMIGQLLRKVGESAQVFCITHLPQVAALAHQHYQVKKMSTAKSTSLTVHALAEKERIEELARMLGGIKITQQTREHAREMLAQS